MGCHKGSKKKKKNRLPSATILLCALRVKIEKILEDKLQCTSARISAAD